MLTVPMDAWEYTPGRYERNARIPQAKPGTERNVTEHRYAYHMHGTTQRGRAVVSLPFCMQVVGPAAVGTVSPRSMGYAWIRRRLQILRGHTARPDD